MESPPEAELLASSLAFHPQPPSQVLSWAAAAGLRGVEVLCDPPWHPGAWPTAERAAARRARDRGALLSLHAPITDVNLMSPHPRVRKLAEEEVRATLALAADIGAGSVTFHLGYRPAMGAAVDPPWEGARAALARLRARARALGVHLCLENDGRHPQVFLGQLPAYRDLLAELALPGTLDLGHAWTVHGAETAALLPDLMPFLHAVHLHDNHGKRDEHLPLGQGTVNLPTLWPQLRALPLKIIEVLTPVAVLESQKWLAQHQAGRRGR